MAKSKNNNQKIVIGISIFSAVLIILIGSYFYGHYQYSRGYSQSQEAISNLESALQQKQTELANSKYQANLLQNDFRKI